MRVAVVVRTSLLLITGVSIASGCAIYNESPDKQGHAATESWGKVGLAAQGELRWYDYFITTVAAVLSRLGHPAIGGSTFVGIAALKNKLTGTSATT